MAHISIISKGLSATTPQKVEVDKNKIRQFIGKELSQGLKKAVLEASEGGTADTVMTSHPGGPTLEDLAQVVAGNFIKNHRINPAKREQAIGKIAALILPMLEEVASGDFDVSKSESKAPQVDAEDLNRFVEGELAVDGFSDALTKAFHGREIGRNEEFKRLCTVIAQKYCGSRQLNKDLFQKIESQIRGILEHQSAAFKQSSRVDATLATAGVESSKDAAMSDTLGTNPAATLVDPSHA